mmetsp:Transcript_17542/g.30203  ORF Transcript_17542/g.30203 Transcript_17542/m.30203 type:complete len:82 (-) Transcript_17542:62-307(-)
MLVLDGVFWIGGVWSVLFRYSWIGAARCEYDCKWLMKETLVERKESDIVESISLRVFCIQSNKWAGFPHLLENKTDKTKQE